MLATSSPRRSPSATDGEVEGEVETRDTQGIVHGAVQRFPPSLYLRETASHHGRRVHHGVCGECPRNRRPRCARAAARHSRSAVRRDHFRSRTDARRDPRLRRHSQSSAAFVRTSLTSSSRRRVVSAFRPVMSADISPATTASPPGGRPCLGGGLCPRTRLHRIRSSQRHVCDRCADVRGAVGLDYPGPRRCAGPAMAAAASC